MGDTKKAAAHKGHATTNNVQENNNTCTDNKSIFDGINLEPFGEWSLLELFINSFSKDQQEQSFEEMPFVKSVIQQSIKEFMKDPQGFIKRVDKEKLFEYLQEHREDFDTDLYNAIKIFCGHELEKMPITWNNKHLNQILMGHFKLTKGQTEKINQFMELIYEGGRNANWRATTSQLFDFFLYVFENKNYEDKNIKRPRPQLRFLFDVSGYFKDRKKIDFDQLTPEKVYSLRKEFKKDCDLIRHTKLNIAETTTDIRDFELMKIKIRKDKCEILFDSDLAAYIMKNNKKIHLHPALDTFTNSKVDQMAYIIARYLNERTENYGTNKKYLHTVKIEELIKRLDITYNPKNQSWRTHIKKPFEKYLACCCEKHYLSKWHYVDNFTGNQLDGNDIKNYTDFIKMSIYFEVDFRGVEHKKYIKKSSKIGNEM